MAIFLGLASQLTRYTGTGPPVTASRLHTCANRHKRGVGERVISLAGNFTICWESLFWELDLRATRPSTVWAYANVIDCIEYQQQSSRTGGENLKRSKRGRLRSRLTGMRSWAGESGYCLRSSIRGIGSQGISQSPVSLLQSQKMSTSDC